MSRKTNQRIGLLLAGLLAANLAFAGTARADECLICDHEVVLDRKLAECFLTRYDILETRQSSAIPVDLSDCPDLEGAEQDRGVVEALKMPQADRAEPDPTFMITRQQLTCLKQRIEEPGITFDPAARIALDDCE